MKYRYDKALDQLVAQHEQEHKPIEPLPISTDLQEQLEALKTIRESMDAVLFGKRLDK